MAVFCVSREVPENTEVKHPKKGHLAGAPNNPDVLQAFLFSLLKNPTCQEL